MTVISRQSRSRSSRSRQSQSSVGRWRRRWRCALAWHWRSCPGEPCSPRRPRSSTSAPTPARRARGSTSRGSISRRARSSAPVLAAESANPSFLAVHPTRDLLYAVNEVGTFDGKPGGSVSAFAINRETGALAAVEPAVVDGWRPGAPHRRPRRQECPRRELWRWKRRGAADRPRRCVEAGVGLHPAHRFERQPGSPEATVRAFGQRRCERSVRLRRGPGHRQGHDLPPRRGQGRARGERPAVCRDRSPAQVRVTSHSIRRAASPT